VLPHVLGLAEGRGLDGLVLAFASVEDRKTVSDAREGRLCREDHVEQSASARPAQYRPEPEHLHKKVIRQMWYIVPYRKPVLELRSVTCRMVSHRVT